MLTVPTSAFITFEEEGGKVLALKNSSPFLLLRRPMQFSEASEPTDIIWENRHFSRMDYFWRQLFAFIVIAILLAGSFILVFVVAQYSATISATYPAVQCDLIE